MTEARPTFLVCGATSGIAEALCRRLAARGWSLILAARDTIELQRLADDLQVRHQRHFRTLAFDAADSHQVQQLVEKAITLESAGIDGVIACHGMSSDNASELNDDVMRETFEINFMSIAAIVNAAAAYFEPRRSGVIAAISSVAGDRGRQSNFVYGAAKAALSTYLQGVRNKLQPLGVHVLTIKPGFVNTRMTRGMKPPCGFLAATPDRVAADIERAIVQRRDVVYTPWFWRWIMKIICAIPEPLFKRLKL